MLVTAANSRQSILLTSSKSKCKTIRLNNRTQSISMHQLQRRNNNRQTNSRRAASSKRLLLSGAKAIRRYKSRRLLSKAQILCNQIEKWRTRRSQQRMPSPWRQIMHRHKMQKYWQRYKKSKSSNHPSDLESCQYDKIKFYFRTNRLGQTEHLDLKVRTL